jgi:hypothetical protein
MERLDEIMSRATIRRQKMRGKTPSKPRQRYQKPEDKTLMQGTPVTISDERIQELKTMPYTEYLLTPEWEEKRRQILERDEHRCRVCNSTEQLNVHHRTYERRGNELMSDLTLLCRSCHEIYHKPQKKDSQTLSDTVNMYISQNVESLLLEENIRGCVEKVLPEIIEQLVRDRLRKMLQITR